MYWISGAAASSLDPTNETSISPPPLGAIDTRCVKATMWYVLNTCVIRGIQLLKKALHSRFSQSRVTLYFFSLLP
jgi:hypothetical protein